MAARGFEVSVLAQEPKLWPELVSVWQSFGVLLGQVSGDFSRAICGQDIERHLDFLGVVDAEERRLHYLGILGLQEELRAHRREQKELEDADPPGSG